MPKITLNHDSDNKTVNLNSLKCSLPVSSFLSKKPNNANIYIGTKNVERWELARQKLSFKNDVDFVTYLLNLIDKNFNTVEDGISRNNNNDHSPKSIELGNVNVASEEFAGECANEIFLINNGVNDKNIEVAQINELDKERDNYLFLNEATAISSACLTENVIDDHITEQHIEETDNQDLNIKEWEDTISQLDIRIKRKKRNSNPKADDENVSDTHASNIRKHKRKKNKHNIIKDKKLRGQRTIKNHDIRKAPKPHKNLKSKYNVNFSDVSTVIAKQDSTTDIEPEENCSKKQNHRVAIKIKTCTDCNSKHVQGACPFIISENYVNDCVSLPDWIEEHKDILGKSNIAFNIDVGSYTFDRYMNEEERSENIELNCESKINTKFTISTYSEASLPYILEFQEVISSHGLSVISKSIIPKFAKLGPLVGKKIKETDIPDDCTMRDIWEVFNDTERLYFSTENPNDSNWVRFLRPAPMRENRNLAVVINEQSVFLVTTKQINESEELLYWIDEHNSLWGKKKLEKSSCGGCNLRFAHALYYRTHCSVFHDPAFSLTIRKYHCKVCGEAVLGKENIMKHAAEMHDGKGAYQCQFCKKFFLRLNYLEMHRTYGCSANPQRSRPLCDFCGRKFCQPQKLKVHIKRMHSDMAEVLRDFQCKLCSKILGSRAALQRHNKEVHSKDVGAVCACPRCGKVFQNKSNLKIHMLTHSGVKPFKCQEINCNAAFTTKQCLQFHYKKVHGYNQDMMPRIERSVAYTFDAYSGGRDDIQSDACRKYSVNSFIENKNDDLLLLHGSDSESLSDIKEATNTQVEDCPSLISTLPEEHLSSTNQISPLLESFHSHENTDHNQINSTNKAQANEVLFMENHMLLKNGFVKDISNSNNSNQSLISKGSKKWLGQTKIQLSDIDGESDNDSPEILHYNDSNILETRELLQDSVYSFNPPQKVEDNSNIILDVGESHSQDYDDNVDLVKINIDEQIDVSNSAGGDDLNPFNSHRVSSSASMLVEAALDSVAHIDMPKENVLHEDHNSDTGVIIVDQLDMHSTSSENNISQSNMLSNINISSDSINIDTMDGYNMNMGHDTDIHNSLTEIKIKQADLISRNNTPNEIHNDMDPHNARYNIQCSSLDSNNMVINKHEMDLTGINQLQAQNMLDLHGRTIDITSPTLIHESEIDVGSLDSSTLQRSVENYTSLHQDDFASPKPDNMTRSLGQEYTIHHDALESPEEHRSRIHYSLPEDTDIVSPAGTPVPRYDFNNHLPTDNLSSDDEGMVQNLSLNIKEKIQQIDLANSYSKQYETNIDSLEFRTKYELDTDFRSDRNFEPLILSSGELQGLDMSSRNYHHNFQMSASTNLNRYHHIYDIAERQSVDLSLTRSAGYASPPSYAHSDVLRVVSLDLTPGGRHSVDLGLPRVTHHSHSSFTSQIQNSRLISDQSGRLISEHRLLSTEHRLLASDHSLSANRLITDPTHLLMEHSMQPTRLLSPDPHSRLLADQSRLLDQTRLLQAAPPAAPDLNTNRSALVSPRGFPGYSVSSSTFHPVRPTVGSPSHTPNPATYHPYSGYY